MINKDSITIIQDRDLAIQVMRNASKWLLKTGKELSKWWKLENLNSKFLEQYAKPEEFFVVIVDNKPAAAAILQSSQNSQDWEAVDKNVPKPALYIHWLCVDHEFAGKSLPRLLIGHAAKKAQENNISLMRIDTNAEEKKLREIYEKLGFSLITTVKEDYRETAFYQKEV